MKKEAYYWLNESLKKYYQFVRVLKKTEKKEVLLYRHRELGKGIVVKRIRGAVPAYEQMVFVRGKHLASVKEVVSNGDETLIVEEYVEGITLAELLQTQRISRENACKIAMQICDGLYVLHKNSMIHRDIKPENIMILPKEEIKIIDFDVMRLYKCFENKDTVMLGTIGYAAPEQYGEAQSDERTDIYAVGILLNVMVTGKHPVNEMVEGELGRIIEKCIMVNPQKRYRDIMELKKQLKKLKN